MHMQFKIKKKLISNEKKKVKNIPHPRATPQSGPQLSIPNAIPLETKIQNRQSYARILSLTFRIIGRCHNSEPKCNLEKHHQPIFIVM